MYFLSVAVGLGWVVSTSAVDCLERLLQSDLLFVEWDVKHCSLSQLMRLYFSDMYRPDGRHCMQFDRVNHAKHFKYIGTMLFVAFVFSCQLARSVCNIIFQPLIVKK